VAEALAIRSLARLVAQGWSGPFYLLVGLGGPFWFWHLPDLRYWHVYAYAEIVP
jgi:hypothetical protein